MEAKISVVFHSGYGHTARQAAAVVDGARSVAGTVVESVPLGPLDEEKLAALCEADAIIFGSPTYMSGASASFREFAESTSKIWGDNLRWKNKVAGGFTNSCNMSGDKLHTLQEMALFAAQHGMIWVGLANYGGWNSSKGSAEDINRLGSWLGAMAQSNTDASPEVAPPASDLRTAAALGRRIALVTHIQLRGRAAFDETP